MKILESSLNVFWLCFLLHLIADFTLQGCLADLKQRDWWKGQIKQIYDKHNGYDKSYVWRGNLSKKYGRDYMAGLICHAFMWSILTYLPLLFIVTAESFTTVILSNAFFHMVVDHMKANNHSINLCEDQIAHLMQIVVTLWIVC